MTEQEHPFPSHSVGVVGYYLPRQVVFAAGAIPVQLHGSWTGHYSSQASRLLGAVDAVTKRILTELLERKNEDLAGLVICNDSAANLRLFYVARMLSKRGELPYPVLLLDCPSGVSPARHRFIRQQYERLREFLAALTGTSPTLRALNEAGEQELRLGEALESLRIQRRAGRCTGSQALNAYLAVSRSSHEQALHLLRDITPDNDVSGTPVYMTGSSHPDATVYQQLEDTGAVVVGEDHASGDGAWLGEAVLGNNAASIYEELVTLHLGRVPLAARALSDERAQYLKTSLVSTKAQYVVGFVRELDDAPVWDIPACKSICEELGLPYQVVARIDTEDLQAGINKIQAGIREGEHARGTNQRSVTGA